jgi:hypothetical protein
MVIVSTAKTGGIDRSKSSIMKINCTTPLFILFPYHFNLCNIYVLVGRGIRIAPYIIDFRAASTS